jgi:8-amino-7-oxononanoate synthase
VPDFSSSLYLGLRHASVDLPPWETLTLGKPAGLDEPALAQHTARALADLVGCADGVLLPSTFHLFWDLLGVLARMEPIEIFMDASTYPIARWGAEHWAGRGVPLRSFAPHDPAHLARLLAACQACPVVLCDAVSPGHRHQPPLAGYAALVQRHGGWLVVDDTQGLGLHGRDPSPTTPYGLGGGGTLQRLGLSGEQVVIGASLAKSFGVPVAVLAGNTRLLQRFRRNSASREHMSPPSMAVMHAAARALEVNRRNGDWRRARLWQMVRRLRDGLRSIGLAAQGQDFPVQTLSLHAGLDMPTLHAELQQLGIATVLHRDRGVGARLSFLLRADHSVFDVSCVLDALSSALHSQRRSSCTR